MQQRNGMESFKLLIFFFFGGGGEGKEKKEKKIVKTSFPAVAEKNVHVSLVTPILHITFSLMQ